MKTIILLSLLFIMSCDKANTINNDMLFILMTTKQKTIQESLNEMTEDIVDSIKFPETEF